MILKTVKELEAKTLFLYVFLYIDKCYNSVINNLNLPINNPKRDILGTYAYAKLD